MQKVRKKRKKTGTRGGINKTRQQEKEAMGQLNDPRKHALKRKFEKDEVEKLDRTTKRDGKRKHIHLNEAKQFHW